MSEEQTNNPISNQEHCQLWMTRNYPEFDDVYTFTEVSELEYIVEWPENRKIVKWAGEDKHMAEIIDYPYVN